MCDGGIIESLAMFWSGALAVGGFMYLVWRFSR